MNLATTVSIYAGGPGSGCHGENCGRPKGVKVQLALRNGKYEWDGKVTSGNTTVTVRKNKYSEVAKATAEYVGDRLFSDSPIAVDIIWDNDIGSKNHALGASSTNKEGTHAQVYLANKRIGSQGEVANLVAHELVHTWQRRNGWAEPNTAIEYHLRAEEIHARRLGEIMGNEFLIKEGSKFGLEADKWANEPKYYKSIAEALDSTM